MVNIGALLGVIHIEGSCIFTRGYGVGTRYGHMDLL